MGAREIRADSARGSIANPGRFFTFVLAVSSFTLMRSIPNAPKE
jgi:hypothetical protein